MTTPSESNMQSQGHGHTQKCQAGKQLNPNMCWCDETTGQKKMLMVQTTERTYFVDETASMDEEGSLVRFYDDGKLLLAVPREAFMWCEVFPK